MSHVLVLEVSDEVYAALRRQAEAAGTSPAHLAVASLERQLSSPPFAGASPTEAEKQAARERFERHFGAVKFDAATGAENESIDADLAREYVDTHEGA